MTRPPARPGLPPRHDLKWPRYGASPPNGRDSDNTRSLAVRVPRCSIPPAGPTHMVVAAYTDNDN